MASTDQSWKKYIYEFLVIFISVSLAFALAKWNENKNNHKAAEKTLLEIKNGLSYDINDFNLNMAGHQRGIEAVGYFRKYLAGEKVRTDSIDSKLGRLLASYISIQNNSSYESLKSQGLGIIEDDSLRLEIISLYDMSYEILTKLEENISNNDRNILLTHLRHIERIKKNLIRNYLGIEKNAEKLMGSIDKAMEN